METTNGYRQKEEEAKAIIDTNVIILIAIMLNGNRPDPACHLL